MQDLRISVSEIIYSSQTSLKWAIRIRWMLIFSGMIIALAAYIISPFYIMPISLVMFFGCLYNLLVMWAKNVLDEQQPDDTYNHYVVILNIAYVLDIVIIGISIYMSGGIESSLYPFYLILMGVIGLTVQRRAAILHAVLASAILSLGFSLQFIGIDTYILFQIESPVHLIGNRIYLIRTLTVQSGFIFTSVYLAGYLQKQLLNLAEAEQHSRIRAEALQQMTTSIAVTHDLDDSLNQILDTLVYIVPFDSAVVMQLQNHKMLISASRGMNGVVLTDVTASNMLAQDLIQKTFATRETTLCQGRWAEEQFKAMFPPGHPTTKSVICAPLVAWDNIVGVLVIGSLQSDFFSEKDARFVATLASSAALAIENIRLYGETHKAAITDGLTGLNNRRALDPMLEKEIARCERYERQLSIAFMDLDHFKQFNDYYGHLSGDDYLRDISRLFIENIRETDNVFRYGGDEFLVLMPETGYPQVLELAERLRSAVERHHLVTKEDSPLGSMTVSIGVAVYPQDAKDANGIIAAADAALFKAKKQHNQVAAFSDTSG